MQREMPNSFAESLEKAASHCSRDGAGQAHGGAGDDSSRGCGEKRVEKVHAPCDAENWDEKGRDLVSDAEQRVTCGRSKCDSSSCGAAQHLEDAPPRQCVLQRPVHSNLQRQHRDASTARIQKKKQKTRLPQEATRS